MFESVDGSSPHQRVWKMCDTLQQILSTFPRYNHHQLVKLETTITEPLQRHDITSLQDFSLSLGWYATWADIVSIHQCSIHWNSCSLACLSFTMVCSAWGITSAGGFCASPLSPLWAVFDIWGCCWAATLGEVKGGNCCSPFPPVPILSARVTTGTSSWLPPHCPAEGTPLDSGPAAFLDVK